MFKEVVFQVKCAESFMKLLKSRLAGAPQGGKRELSWQVRACMTIFPVLEKDIIN